MSLKAAIARLNKKRIRSMIRLWVDDDHEYEIVYAAACAEMLHDIYNYNIFRSKLIERELEKCVKEGVFEKDGKNRIHSMLYSVDPELSEVGLNIIYSLREQRLKMKNEKINITTETSGS